MITSRYLPLIQLYSPRSSARPGWYFSSICNSVPRKSRFFEYTFRSTASKIPIHRIKVPVATLLRSSRRYKGPLQKSIKAPIKPPQTIQTLVNPMFESCECRGSRANAAASLPRIPQRTYTGLAVGVRACRVDGSGATG